MIFSLDSYIACKTALQLQMEKMKVIKAKQHKFSSILSILFFMLLLGYFSIQIFPFSSSDVGEWLVFILGFVWLVFIFWLFNYPSYHYYLYDNESIVVKNSWNFLVDRWYYFKDIEKISVTHIYKFGDGLAFTFRNRKRRRFASMNLSGKDLENYAQILNSHIEAI